MATPSWPALRGGSMALLAAVLFGISTPLVQRFGVGLGAFSTAALLYAGAAAVGALSRQRIQHEARIVRGDWPRLLDGGLVLVLDQGRSGGAQLWGLMAVLLATAAWGVDNTLSRALAERDPGQVVLAKAVLGAVATTLLSVTFGEPLPSLGAALALLAIGATGYGLSLRFYLLAQRAFGAARTGSVFAFAPFIGAAFVLALGNRSMSGLMVLGGVLMLAGVLLHLAESHGHVHVHEALVHAHAHRHDDGHHDHVRDPMPVGAHSHRHQHPRLRHAHPHVPDAHHVHRH